MPKSAPNLQSNLTAKKDPSHITPVLFVFPSKFRRIIVSKKTAPRAVKRNRMRRMVREALRSLNLKDNLKIVIKNDFSDAKMSDVKEKLIKLLKNAQKNS